MANNTKKGKITIANMMAIIGLVLLLVFTFVGHSYMSGGEIGWDILISVAITAFCGLLLWFIIKAKGAETNVNKWRIIEFSTLACYILFAIPSSLFGGIMHFFVVNDKKEDIKQYVIQDLEKINGLFSDYEGFEDTVISKTGIQLMNAIAPNRLCDTNLNQFMTDRRIGRSERGVQTFEELQRGNLLGDEYKEFRNGIDSELRTIESTVMGWSIMQIPFQAKRIGDIAENVGNALSELSGNASLPEIEYDYSKKRYTIVKDNQTKEFKLDPNNLRFRNALQQSRGFSWTALVVVLLIHLLILFNYIAAYRTNKLDVGAKGIENDGGTVL